MTKVAGTHSTLNRLLHYKVAHFAQKLGKIFGVVHKPFYREAWHLTTIFQLRGVLGFWGFGVLGHLFDCKKTRYVL